VVEMIQYIDIFSVRIDACLDKLFIFTLGKPILAVLLPENTKENLNRSHEAL
jgi:hypothetical protein